MSLQERYMPCTVRWFFERSQLISRETVNKQPHDRVLLTREETTPERVASAHCRVAAIKSALSHVPALLPHNLLAKTLQADDVRRGHACAHRVHWRSIAP